MLDGSLTFPNLRELVLSKIILMGLKNYSLLSIRGMCARGASSVNYVGTSVVLPITMVTGMQG